MEYNLVKKAIRNAIEQITTSDSWNQEPVVIVDYHSWMAHSFKDSFTAERYLEKHCDLGDWCDRELPFSGEEDNEIVVIKYCGGYTKMKHPSLYKDYKFYKKINGVEIYRKKTLANFEASVSLNVNV